MVRNRTLRGGEGAPPYFLVTAFTTMMLVTGMNILVPVLPGYARSFQVDATQVGVVVSAFAVGRLLFDFAGGALADKFGVRIICITGCAVTGVASLVAGLTESFSMLLAARLVQGVGSALYMSAATALVVALLPSGRAGRWMSIYQGIFLLGLAVGPLLGGVVAGLFGLRAPFHAYALMCLVSLVLSTLCLPGKSALQRLTLPSKGSPDHEITPGAALRRLLQHPAFRVSLLAILTMFIIRAGVRNTAVPLYADEALNMSSVMIGLLVTTAAVGQLAVMWHAGKVLDSWGRRPVLIASLFGATASVLLFGVAVDPWILFVCMLSLGLTTAYSTAAPTVIMVDVADPRITGSAVGIQRMATDCGQLAGPILVGVMVDGTNFTVTFMAAAGLVLLTALAALSLPETRHLANRRPDRDPQTN